MKTGASAVDITPDREIELAGYLSRVQPSVGVYHPIYTRALYLEDGGSRLLWLNADLAGLERDDVLKVKESLADKFGLRAEQVVVSATHTHSAPATAHLNKCGDYDADYVGRLRAWMLEAATGAVENVEETRVFFGEGSCDLAVDRRQRPSAHVDHRLPVMGWRRADQTWAAVLSNYPMHNVVLCSRYISGDVAGCAAHYLSGTLPGAPVALCTNGACGNINPARRKKVSLEHSNKEGDAQVAEEYGRVLGDAVIAALESARPIDAAALETRSETVNIGLDTPDERGVRDIARKGRAGYCAESDYVGTRFRQAFDAWEETMLKKLREGTMPTHVPMDLQVVSIGGIFFVCIGAEVFSIMADQLRSETGRTVYVVGYAGGNIGYFFPASAYSEGGYEVGEAFVFYGNLRPAPDAFETVMKKAAAMVREMNT
jgi:hypothetical protein